MQLQPSGLTSNTSHKLKKSTIRPFETHFLSPCFFLSTPPTFTRDGVDNFPWVAFFCCHKDVLLKSAKTFVFVSTSKIRDSLAKGPLIQVLQNPRYFNGLTRCLDLVVQTITVTHGALWRVMYFGCSVDGDMDIFLVTPCVEKPSSYTSNSSTVLCTRFRCKLEFL